MKAFCPFPDLKETLKKWQELGLSNSRNDTSVHNLSAIDDDTHTDSEDIMDCFPLFCEELSWYYLFGCCYNFKGNACSNQDTLQYSSSWVGKCDWAPVVLKHAKYLGSKIDPRYQIIVATHSAKCKVLCEKCAEFLKTDTKSTSNLCCVYRRHVYMR